MTSDSQDWLSTGQAAELCAVTPATVLNWIRTGKLESVRTPGGHFRVKRDRLDPMMARRKVTFQASGGRVGKAHLRCWEYLSDRGTVRHECLDCIVHKVRAGWCFQIATLGLDTGHARRFCPTSCDDCAYYRRVKGIPTNVLVVTSDTNLIEALREDPAEDVVLKFARNPYEASALVENFLPAFAVVDLETPAARESSLIESLGKDPRLPGLKTVVALRPGRQGRGWRGRKSLAVAGRIEKPFGLDEIRAVIDSFPVEPLPPGDPIQERLLLKGGPR